MSQPEVGPGEPRTEPRTEEKIARMFPDRGEFPGNRVVADPEASPAPNIQHPE